MSAGGPEGVVLWDKPSGVSSHDVVIAARRRLGKGVKVGHAGTLDPFATGLCSSLSAAPPACSVF